MSLIKNMFCKTIEQEAGTALLLSAYYLKC